MGDAASSLTLEEQIGQVLMVGFTGTTATPQLVKLIRQYHVGNIILFSRNLQSVQQVRALTENLQDCARSAGQRQPLLIAVDQENGMVQRLGTDATIFPGSMALGAVGEEHSAYEVALAAGQELRALGINLNLAPVVDVNNNPANPVIGVRSFGEDAGQVARLAGAQIRGYQQAGVATCVKHFPGHGDTATDSHLAMPVVPYEMERLERVELVPFKTSIAAGSDCVMTAHISFPALTGTGTLPATLSAAVIGQLLREQLGFPGVIITDCLEMNAVSQGVGVGRGSVLALQAGNDLVLISHRYDRQLAGIEALKAALRSGEIAPARIQEAAGRVLALKSRLGERERRQAAPALAEVGSAGHRRLGERIYACSTTLVRDEQALLPLRLAAGQRLLLIYTHRAAWTQVEDRGYPEAFLVEQLRRRHPRTEVRVLGEQTSADEDEQLYDTARQADAILMVTVNALHDARQVQVMQNLLKLGRPLIGLAPYSPYDLLAFPELATYLVTYEYTAPAIAAAVGVLFGEIAPRGRLPVSLPGLYPLRT
ncbi:MAG TPA: beta-N-acetylhexosaminidase [Ktedonobacteraceae bacterium]|jgi:beta-N-acetylhexosaminidase